MMTGGAAAMDPWRDPALRALESEVASTEAALIDAEVELETLRVEVANFARVHHQRLGPLYARLDELDALIAEAIAARTGDLEDIQRAYQARGVVDELPDLDELFARLAGQADGSGSPGGAGDAGRPADQDDATAGPDERGAESPPLRVRPSKQAQRLYRELARRAHPDLTQDEDEKRRRDTFIARVNAAYAQDDLDQLARLGEEWAAGGDAEPVSTPGDRVSWLRTRLDWLRAALAALAAQRAELIASAIGQLMSLAPDDPDGLLVELAERLASSVTEREARLDSLLADL